MKRFFVCLYCGELLELEEAGVKLLGKPKCCQHLMAEIDMNKVHTIVSGLDKLKTNLEKEILRGLM